MEKHMYYIVSYCGTREVVVQTRQEYEALVKRARDYSNNNKKNYLFGNITREDGPDGIHVTGHIYKKLVKEPFTLSELLNYTSGYTKKEFAELYRGETGMKEGYIPDINIAYKRDKVSGQKETTHRDRRILYLPMVYKEDRMYMSMGFIKSCLKYHVFSGTTTGFGIIKGLANELCFNKDCAAELEKLYITLDRCQNQNLPLQYLYNAAEALIDKYVCEVDDEGVVKRKGSNKKGQGEYIISKRRVLDVGMYFKYCGDMSKKHSPVRYNEDPDRETKKKIKEEEEKRRLIKLIESGNYMTEQLTLF